MPNSYVAYTGTGTDTDFSFAGIDGYLSSNYIKVYVDGIIQTTPADYVLFLQPGTKEAQFVTAPVLGAAITIIRETPRAVDDFEDQVVNFTDGSLLTAQDLDRGFQGLLHISQEIGDGGVSALGKLPDGTAWDAKNLKIRNVLDGSHPADAVNKLQLELVAKYGPFGSAPQHWEHTVVEPDVTELALPGASPSTEPSLYLVEINGSIIQPTVYEISVDTGKNYSIKFFSALDLDDVVQIRFLGSGITTIDVLQPDSITTENLNNLCVTHPKLALNAVESENIAADAVLAAHMANDSVTTASIVNLSVTGAKIAAATITGNKLVAGTVTTDKIASQAITAAELDSGSVTTSKLDMDAVTSSRIKDGAISNAKLDPGLLLARTNTTNTWSGTNTFNGTTKLNGYVDLDRLLSVNAVGFTRSYGTNVTPSAWPNGNDAKATRTFDDLVPGSRVTIGGVIKLELWADTYAPPLQGRFTGYELSASTDITSVRASQLSAPHHDFSPVEIGSDWVLPFVQFNRTPIYHKYDKSIPLGDFVATDAASFAAAPKNGLYIHDLSFITPASSVTLTFALYATRDGTVMGGIKLSIPASSHLVVCWGSA